MSKGGTRLGEIMTPSLSIALALALGPHSVQAQKGLEDVGFVMGDTAASVKIIEFSDFGCESCAEFWRESWPQIRSELIETGRVVWWTVPVTVGYRRGKEAANAAQCGAEQSGFWPMHELLMDGQDEWLSVRHPEEVYVRMAGEAGLDVVLFTACYGENRWEERIAAATAVARRGVRAMPTFFVNERPVVGSIPYELFLQVVEDAERDDPGRRP
jgi:protein-disulfide isomerase